jgi:hypothetical protein
MNDGSNQRTPSPAIAPEGAAERECETCRGVGTIDERLGGHAFSNPAVECPDCEGKGFLAGHAPPQPPAASAVQGALPYINTEDAQIERAYHQTNLSEVPHPFRASVAFEAGWRAALAAVPQAAETPAFLAYKAKHWGAEPPSQESSGLTEVKRCACGYPEPCNKTVPVGFCKRATS